MGKMKDLDIDLQELQEKITAQNVLISEKDKYVQELLFYLNRAKEEKSNLINERKNYIAQVREIWESTQDETQCG